MKTESKNILLGIGNSLRGDDGAGSFIARNFHHHLWISLDSGTAPENFTSKIKDVKPNLLIIIDAAELNLASGAFRIIPYNKISELQFSTHSIPLSFLLDYLKSFCKEIIMIGIQPGSTNLSDNLSQNVLVGCKKIIKYIKDDKVKEIKVLNDLN